MFQQGQTIANKYTIERELGRGGMGTIYAAHHIALGRLEALKCMNPEVCRSDADIERFRREAAAAGRLKSQHTVRIFDVDVLPTGEPYIAMEYLEGIDLDKHLRQNGPLPIEDAVHFLLQACDAVAEAHSMGIVHRDLKPANLFLATGAHGLSSIKVLDFGIAKFLGAAESPDDPYATKAGFAMGSPIYMPPEQVASAKHADTRSDIWALGVILFRLLTREMPFQSNAAIPRALLVLNQDPMSPRHFRAEIPMGLDNIIMKCLRKDPAERFQHVSDLANALVPYTKGIFANSMISTLPLQEPIANTRTKTQGAVPAGAAKAPSPSIQAQVVPAYPPAAPAANENPEMAARERTGAPPISNTIRPPNHDRRARTIGVGIAMILSIILLVFGLLLFIRPAKNTPELAASGAREASSSLPGVLSSEAQEPPSVPASQSSRPIAAKPANTIVLKEPALAKNSPSNVANTDETKPALPAAPKEPAAPPPGHTPENTGSENKSSSQPPQKKPDTSDFD